MSVSTPNTIRKAFAKAGVLEYTDFGTVPKLDRLALDLLNDVIVEWGLDPELNPGNMTYVTGELKNPEYIKVSADPNETDVDVPIDFNRILNISAQWGESLSQPVFPMSELTLAEYSTISVKKVPSIPTRWAWDQQHPVGYIYLYPMSLPTLLFRITGIPSLAITTPNANIPLPDYYSPALTATLALRILSVFPRDNDLLKNTLLGEVGATLKNIKKFNRRSRIPNLAYNYHGAGHGSVPDFFQSSWNNVVK
jgi:hypothetical protein